MLFLFYVLFFFLLQAVLDLRSRDQTGSLCTGRQNLDRWTAKVSVEVP